MLVQDPLVVKVLDGSVRDGDHVVVDADNTGKLTFETSEHEHASSAV